MAEMKTKIETPKVSGQEQKPAPQIAKEEQKPAPQVKKDPELRQAFREMRIEKDKTEEKLGFFARLKEFATPSDAQNAVAAGGGVLILTGLAALAYEAITVPGASIANLDPMGTLSFGLMIVGSMLMLFSDNIGRAVYSGKI